MKKFLACVLLLGLVVALSSPVFAWDASKQKALGQDKNKMTWYILDYGKDSAGVPFAVSRKYYTNTTIKNETIELLMSKFGLSPEVAGSLYFTEYGYEYTPDGKQYAMTYLRHYDMLGNVRGREQDVCVGSGGRLKACCVSGSDSCGRESTGGGSSNQEGNNQYEEECNSSFEQSSTC